LLELRSSSTAVGPRNATLALHDVVLAKTIPDYFAGEVVVFDAVEGRDC
jgi:hypothetical protein